MTQHLIDSSSNIIWVDSNINLQPCLQPFTDANMRVACFHETADALNALRQNKLKIQSIECVITSMMERGGRKERGCLNGLQMLDQIKQMFRGDGDRQKPIFAVISSSADVKECKKHEVDIIVFGDYNTLQQHVINQIRTRRKASSNKGVILLGIAGPSGCGKSTYSRHLAESLNLPFPVICLDSYFKGPILIDHPKLGKIQSWEDPLALKVDYFRQTLEKIKRDWRNSELLEKKQEIDSKNPIVVVVEGFILFALSDAITSMFDIRIFFDSTLERCRLQRYRREHKINRDTPDSAVVIPPDFIKWFDNLVWDEYLKRRKDQMLKVDKVFDLGPSANQSYLQIDRFVNRRLKEYGIDNIEEIDKLAKTLDQIDEKYGKSAANPSDILYNRRVAEKEHVFNKIKALVPLIADHLSLPAYLLSASYGYQNVAIQWIQYKKDSSQVNVLCYILLNSASNFLKYHLLAALFEIVDQCSIEQLQQIERSLIAYKVPDGTGQDILISKLLKIIRLLLTFSISNILLDSYLWRDVENKFFNSLSGLTKYRLKNLHAIRNELLFQKFENCRRSFCGKDNILYLYHGASAKSLRMIAKEGFREVHDNTTIFEKSKPLDAGYFGKGIYHGFAADYAILYSERYRQSNEILFSAVLPGRSYIVKKGGEKLGKGCEPNHDSHISPENKELVVFRSEQILPLFIIEFIEVPHSLISEESI